MIELKFIGENIADVNKQALAYLKGQEWTAPTVAQEKTPDAAPANDSKADEPTEDKPRRSRKPKEEPADNEPTYPTLDEMREVASKIPGDDDDLQDAAFALVEKLGAKKMSEIKPEDRQKFIDGINALLEGGKKSRRSLD